MTRSFETRTPIKVRIGLPAGEVEVETTDEGMTTVELEPQNEAAEEIADKVRIELRGDELTIEVPAHGGSFRSGPEFEVQLRCPSGSSARVHTASADVSLRGRYGDVEAKTASGDIQVERAEGTVNLASASGDIEVEEGRGAMEVSSVSGDVEIGQACAGLKASTISGDLRVRRAEGGAEVHTTSGDLSLDGVGVGVVRAETVSGDVEARILPGLDVWIDAGSTSGDTTSELEPIEGAPASREKLVELRAHSLSGDVTIGRAS